MSDSEALPRLIDALPQTKLGEGSVGEVWHAISGGRDVAIKTINQPYSDAQRKSIETEINALRRLSHPAIPTLYDFDLDSSRPCIVMEYIEGEPFHRLIADAALWTIPMPKRLAILAQIAAAADYLHAQGLIHRDIKPANIIGIDAPHLIDFGIAAEIGATVSPAGTPFYMLPGDQPPGIAHDRFGFALTAYEFLFGVHAIYSVGDSGLSRDDLRSRFTERLREGTWRKPSQLAAHELPYDLRGVDLARLDSLFEWALTADVTDQTSLTAWIESLSDTILTPVNQPFLDKMPEIAISWMSGVSETDLPDEQTSLFDEKTSLPDENRQPSRRIVIGAVIMISMAVSLIALLQNAR